MIKSVLFASKVFYFIYECKWKLYWLFYSGLFFFPFFWLECKDCFWSSLRLPFLYTRFLLSFSVLWRLSFIILLNIFCKVAFFSMPSGTPIIHVFDLLMALLNSWTVFLASLCSSIFLIFYVFSNEVSSSSKTLLFCLFIVFSTLSASGACPCFCLLSISLACSSSGAQGQRCYWCDFKLC